MNGVIKYFILIVGLIALFLKGCESQPKKPESFLADNWNLPVSDWNHWKISYQNGKNYFLAKFRSNDTDSTAMIIIIPGDSLCFKSSLFSNPRDNKYSIRRLSQDSQCLFFDLNELLIKSRFVIDNEIQEIYGVDGCVYIRLMKDDGYFIKAENDTCITIVAKDRLHSLGDNWYKVQ